MFKIDSEPLILTKNLQNHHNHHNNTLFSISQKKSSTNSSQIIFPKTAKILSPPIASSNNQSSIDNTNTNNNDYNSPFLHIQQLHYQARPPSLTQNRVKYMDAPPKNFFKSDKKIIKNVKAQTRQFIKNNPSITASTVNETLLDNKNLCGISDKVQFPENNLSLDLTKKDDSSSLTKSLIQAHNKHNSLIIINSSLTQPPSTFHSPNRKIKPSSIDQTILKEGLSTASLSNKILAKLPKDIFNEISESKSNDKTITHELYKNDIIKSNQAQINEILHYSSRNKHTSMHITNLTSMKRPLSGINNITTINTNSSLNNFTRLIFTDKNKLTKNYHRPFTSSLDNRRLTLNMYEKGWMNKAQSLKQIIKKSIPNEFKTQQYYKNESRSSIFQQSTSEQIMDTSPMIASNLGPNHNTNQMITSNNNIIDSKGDNSPIKEENNLYHTIVEDIPFEEKLRRINGLYRELAFEDMINDDIKIDRSGFIVKGTLDTNKPFNKKIIEFGCDEYSEIQESIKKLNSKFSMIVKNDNLFKNESKKNDFLKVNPEKLTSIELNFIRDEYMKKALNHEVQWSKLDDILSKSKFFSKYLKNIRLSLLRHANYVEYKQGHVIFKEGDYGDLMYVILNGSINVKVKMINPEGIEEDILIACLYEGNSFGELTMLRAEKLLKTKKGDDLMEKLLKKRTYKEIKSELENNKWDQNKVQQKVIQSNFSILSSTSSDETSEHSSNNNSDNDINHERTSINSLGNDNNNANNPNGHDHLNNNIKTNNLIKQDSIDNHCSSMNNLDNKEYPNSIPMNPTAKKANKPKKLKDHHKPRAATIEVAQSVALLSIPKRYYKKILVSLIQKELEQKVKVLLCLPFFEKQEPLSLLPLANNLITQNFRMGEKIIKSGDMPQFFGIISNGQCKVAMEISIKKNIQSIPLVKGQGGRLRNLSFSHDTNVGAIPNFQDNKFKDLKIHIQNPLVTKTRTFEFDPVEIDYKNNVIIYKQHIVLTTLSRGNFFGIRALLDDILNELKYNKEKIESYKAKLDIIADTSNVEVYSIDRKHLQYVPEFLKKALLEGLQHEKDYDEFNIDHIKGQAESWNYNKKKVMNNSLIETYSTRINDYKVSDFKKF